MIRTRLAPAAVSAPARAVRRLAGAPTVRAILLFGLGVLWLVPAWIDPRAVFVMLAWNAVVLLAVTVDAMRLPAPAALCITRRWDGPLTLGVPATVLIDVQNGGAIPIAVRVTDYLEPALRPDVTTLDIAGFIPPGRTATATYELSPRERGDATATEVVVEWRSSWGLLTRWAQAAVPQTVRVYPNIQEGRRHAMYLIRSRQVALEKRHARRATGGREFDRLREYRPGDERRDISWRATARRARLVSRIYQPERSQTVWLLVDAGRLLRARSGRETLLDRATTAALGLAQVAMTSGDNVGLVAYGRRVQHRLAPARGAAHLRRLLEALATVRAEAVEADHAAAAAALRTGQKRRALVVWLTDVAETAGLPDVIEQASGLVSRHVVLFATMRQPEVAQVAASRPSNGADMYRMLAAQEAVDRREALLRGLRQRGALVIETSPQELTGGLVDRYLDVKERGLI